MQLGFVRSWDVKAPVVSSMAKMHVVLVFPMQQCAGASHNAAVTERPGRMKLDIRQQLGAGLRKVCFATGRPCMTAAIRARAALVPLPWPARETLIRACMGNKITVAPSGVRLEPGVESQDARPTQQQRKTGIVQAAFCPDSASSFLFDNPLSGRCPVTSSRLCDVAREHKHIGFASPLTGT